MGTRKQFTPEFKREAVQLLESGSRPAPRLPASWGLPGINSTNGRRNYGLVGPPRFQARGRARNGRPRWPG